MHLNKVELAEVLIAYKDRNNKLYCFQIILKHISLSCFIGSFDCVLREDMLCYFYRFSTTTPDNNVNVQEEVNFDVTRRHDNQDPPTHQVSEVL